MNAGNDSAREAADLLAPLVARVVDLGRGPPALVGWIAAPVRRGLCPKQLAGSLARTLRRAASPATAETIRDRRLGASGANDGEAR